jgi:hypothetical protein
MVNYQNGKIYSIRSYSRPDLVYIGSTCNTLPKRLYVHKQKYNSWLRGKYCYTSSFKIIEIGDAYIELVEEYACENNQQLRRREGEIIRKTECVNIRVAGRTKKQQVEENKEEIDIYKKNWYEDNKEVILVRAKKRYEDNKEVILKKVTCECGKNISKCSLTRHKRTKAHQKYIDLCWWT